MSNLLAKPSEPADPAGRLPRLDSPAVFAVFSWLIRDTFWQALASRIFWIMLGVSVLFATGAAAQPAGSREKPNGPKPTVVFVHGAFADASGWSAEVEQLQREGYPVIAPANPLRGVSSDAGYIASVLDTVTGPIVLVGHSYGGVVITNAAAMTKNTNNIKALVYIAAYIPDVGQAAQALTPLPGSQIVLPLPGATAPTVILRPCPPANCVLASTLTLTRQFSPGLRRGPAS